MVRKRDFLATIDRGHGSETTKTRNSRRRLRNVTKLRSCDLVLLCHPWLSSLVTRETEMVCSVAFSLESLASLPRGRDKRGLCVHFTIQGILHALSLFKKQQRLRQTSNKSYRTQNLLNWDYWEVNFRCNIHRHRFLSNVVVGKII